MHLITDTITCDFNTLTSGFDAVVHLAAKVHQPNPTDIHAYMPTNHDATVALAKACAANKVSKFITLSISHVYEGLNDDFTESQALSPVSPYAQSKYKATRELDPIFIDTGSEWYVIRPPLIYAQGVKGNLNSLPKLVGKLSLLPFRRAESEISYISVHKLCDFILHLVQNNITSDVYNVSDNNDLSTNVLCKLIGKAQGKKIIQLPVPKWMMKAAFRLIR